MGLGADYYCIVEPLGEITLNEEAGNREHNGCQLRRKSFNLTSLLEIDASFCYFSSDSRSSSTREQTGAFWGLGGLAKNFR